MGSLLKFISNGTMLDFIANVLDSILNTILSPILWALCDIFFFVIDMFEDLYQTFAGISEFAMNGETVSQDPVLYLINTDVVQEMFFSILSLSLLLLVIFTILAIVKNMYSDKPKPIGEILSGSVKGMLMYLLVPVATIVCLLAGNIVLRAIDGATKLEGATGISDMLFTSAAHNANWARGGDKEKITKLLTDGYLSPNEGDTNTKLKQEYIKAMASGGIDVSEGKAEYNGNPYNAEIVADAIDKAFLRGIIGKGGSKWDRTTVLKYYSIVRINLITVWAGGAFMIFALGKISWGLISRLFKMTVFYAISPALMAMYPIDNGQAVGKWRGEMVKNGTMAYCAVGVLNVVMSILPAFGQLTLFENAFVNGLAILFIDIVALSSAEKLIGTVSGWFGTGDAMAEGRATSDAFKKAVKKPGEIGKKIDAKSKKALTTVSSAFSGWNAAKTAGNNRLWGAIRGIESQSKYAENRKKTQEAWQKGKKGGEEYYDNIKTKTWRGTDKKAIVRDDSGKAQWERHGIIFRRQRDSDITRAEEFAGRKQVAEENKKLEKILPAYNAETDPIKKEMLLNKIKSISSVVAENIKDAEEQAKIMEAKIQSKTENVSSFEKVSSAGSRAENIAKKIFGRDDVDDRDIDKLESGDLGSYSADVQQRYAQYAEMYNQANMDFEDAKKELVTLATSDEATKEMMGKMNVTLADIQALSIGEDYSTGKRHLEDFDTKLEGQTTEIQNMKNSLKTLKKDIKDDISKYAQSSVDKTVNAKTYGKIGKGKK